MRAISSGASAKPKTSKFAAMRSGSLDFGITTKPCSMPAQDDLTRRDAVALGDLLEHRVVRIGRLERAVALERHAARAVGLDDDRVVERRRPLDLVDGRATPVASVISSICAAS